MYPKKLLAVHGNMVVTGFFMMIAKVLIIARMQDARSRQASVSGTASLECQA